MLINAKSGHLGFGQLGKRDIGITTGSRQLMHRSLYRIKQT